MFKRTILGISILMSSQFLGAETNETPSGEDLIKSKCMGCHLPTDEGLSRISYQRKTPEGWEMTINRMELIHGLKISNQQIPADTSAIHAMVKYLSDTQGLAPSETDGLRYLLEHDLNREENFEPLMSETCGRCHSSARVALQRRPEKEWQHLIDFHLGQWPSTEYSLYGRDRNWLKVAREEIVPQLSKDYPIDSEAWSDWQKADKPELTGSWVFNGHMPGKGFFHAVMKATETRPDYFDLSVSGRYDSGEHFEGSGKAVVYTGFEWRGSINFGEIKLRQVLAASEDGNNLTGRFYQKGQELMGLNIDALKDSTSPQLLGVYPNSIRQGETAQITLSGTALLGDITINGLSIKSIVNRDQNHITLNVEAAKNAAEGLVKIQVGKASLDGQLAVYQDVDSLQVEPAYGIARIGGNGGTRPKVETIFRAKGVSFGADGIQGTADDLSLGVMDQVQWQVVPRDEVAAHDEDVKFAGTMNATTGVFQPADAGPNPDRKRSTNNAGNLDVKATLQQDDKNISALARLLVAVQVWIDPPLK